MIDPVAELEELREIRRRAADLAYELASVNLPPDAERLLSLLDDALERAASKGLAIKCPSSEIGQDDGRFPLIRLLRRGRSQVGRSPLSPRLPFALDLGRRSPTAPMSGVATGVRS